jgi:uncharacterized protein YneF (UPF0154 family)
VSWQLAFALLGGFLALILGFVLGCVRRARTEPTAKLPPLNDRAMRAALLVDDTEPWWRAVMQCLDVQRDAAVQELADVNKQQPALMHFYAGSVAQGDQLRAFLHEQRELARTNLDDED